MRLALLLTLLGCAAPLATPAPPMPPVANRGEGVFLQAVASHLYGTAPGVAVQAGNLDAVRQGIGYCDGVPIPRDARFTTADWERYRAIVEVAARLYLC